MTTRRTQGRISGGGPAGGPLPPRPRSSSPALPVVRRKQVASGIGSQTRRHYCATCGQKIRACECEDVYFIQRGDDGPIKIGHVRRVSNLLRRMRDIQNACAEPVYLRKIIPTTREDHLELVLHWRFAEHRLKGEWFAPAPRVVEYMERKSANSEVAP